MYGTSERVLAVLVPMARSRKSPRTNGIQPDQVERQFGITSSSPRRQRKQEPLERPALDEVSQEYTVVVFYTLVVYGGACRFNFRHTHTHIHKDKNA